MIKIMAVDDEREAELLFNYFFKKEMKENKLRLDFYTSARECLEAIKENEGDVDYVLSDINMPQMDGFEFLHEVHKDYPSIKFFMVSAYENATYRKRAKEMGAFDYVSKPIDFEELKDKILSL